MRLLTWNACKGQFARKVPLLDRLCADISVVQEIAEPTFQSERVLWFGDNPNQGLAIVARQPYSLRRLDQKPGVPKYIIPVAVVGPTPFVLFAVWTLGAQPMRYVRAAATAIETYESMFRESPVVLLGDFNSNTIWDKDHPAHLNHSSVVRRLEKLGLVSAYHHHRNEAHGSESEHTFYLHWDERKPYHIDYCFLPSQWATQIQRVEIGSFEAWKGYSDHRPLLIELLAEV